MPEAFPAQVVLAIATVIAALIAGVMALVNLTLSKEQKVSELRQAWIDGLRDDLARFLSGVRAKAVHLQDIRDGITLSDKEKGDSISSTVGERTAVAQEALYRVKLRLNSAEVEHKELERLLDGVLSTYYQMRGPTDKNIQTEVQHAIDRVTVQARSILKTEWERVKRGEKSFVNLKKFLLPSIVIITIVFTAVVLWVKFK